MSMKFFILTLLIINCAAQGIAQEKKKEPLKRFLIGASLGDAPFPKNSLTILSGAEVYISPRFSVFNEVALLVGNKYDSGAYNKNYFRYKAELRLYLTTDINNVKPYFALQYTSARRSFDTDIDGSFFRNGNTNTIYRYKSASINSPVQTGTLQFGLSIKGYGNFYVDLATGFGVRETNTTYSNAGNPAPETNGGLRLFAIDPMYRYEGRLSRIQLNLNFRVSYRF